MIAPEVNRRTNAGKEQEKEFLEMCEKENITPITNEDNRKLSLMKDSTMAHPIARWCLEAKGIAESSIYWKDKDTDILCRCRPDKLIQEHHWIVDVKAQPIFSGSIAPCTSIGITYRTLFILMDINH